jgi:outer membrane protein assembly factor BamE (lipoprotein component of BamABCDE complex)
MSCLARLIFAGMLAGAVMGCNPTEFGQKQISDPSKVNQIQKGVSTKESIKAAFGDPTGTAYEANGDEVWNYFYSSHSINPANLIPVVDIVHHVDPSQTASLSVTFDGRGFVKAYSINNQSFGQSGWNKRRGDRIWGSGSARSSFLR